MSDILQRSLLDSLRTITGGVAEMLPKLFIALVLVILGWIFGVAVARVVHQLVTATKADEWLAKAGVDKFLSRAGYKLDTPRFFAVLANIFFVLVFLIPAFDVLGLSQVNVYLAQVLDYIPQVIVAAFILLTASIAADLMSNLVSGGTRAVGSRVSEFLGTMTRWAIWMFAILTALSQLGIAPQYMYTIFAGFVAMLALAGGLAFGLGGKEAAAQLIKDIQKEVSEK